MDSVFIIKVQLESCRVVIISLLGNKRVNGINQNKCPVCARFRSIQYRYRLRCCSLTKHMHILYLNYYFSELIKYIVFWKTLRLPFINSLYQWLTIVPTLMEFADKMNASQRSKPTYSKNWFMISGSLKLLANWQTLIW